MSAFSLYTSFFTFQVNSPIYRKMSSDQAGGKAWELSVYELQRTAQEIICDKDKQVAISPRTLHSELMCPICLDMLKTTMTTKECLHRFCQECIITALRSGNKECPTCRKKLVSKRSLRPDPNFDSLIAKIYPSRDEYDALQERVIAKLNKSSSQQALLNSIEEGLKIQSASRPARGKKGNVTAPAPSEDGQATTAPSVGASGRSTPNTGAAEAVSTPGTTPRRFPPGAGRNRILSDETESIADSLASGSGPESSVIDGAEGPNFVDSHGSSSLSATGGGEVPFREYELEIRPHPEDQALFAKDGKELPTRFVKTGGNATIEHIINYLQMRLALDQDCEISTPFSSFTIFVSPPATANSSGASTSLGMVLLQPVQTLEEVFLKNWRTNKPLQLSYSVTRAPA